MNGTYAAVRAGARPTRDDDRSLLEDLLVAPAPAWATPARLRPVGGRCRPAPAWPAARKGAVRPLAAAATLLLAGGIVATSVGVAPARAAVGAAPAAQLAAPAALAPAVAPAPASTSGARGALAALRVAPAGDTALLARLLTAPAAQADDAALLAALLASEPPAVAVAAPPAAVSFATVVGLPASALSYTPAVQQLPMITLADNLPPPPPPVRTVAAQQTPPPPGYVPPPGYRDGQYLGGQYPGLAPGQFPATTRPATSRPATTRPSTGRPAMTRPAVYIVRAGDTLSAIALRFYGDARYAPRLWDANYRVIGANPNAIFPGQRLSLPGLTALPVARPAAPLPARGPISQRANYTILPRDYLRWIAQRAYGTEIFWPEIYHANRNVLGPNPDLIYPGVTIYIP